MDHAEAFKRASDGFAARIRAVRPDRWHSPSPCAPWTARDVVAHVINEQRRMLSTVRGVDPEPVHGVGIAEMGTIPELAADADLAAAWDQVGSGHTWDLARATGGDERLDPDVVRQVHEALKPLEEFFRQPWAFGPKVDAPPGADAQTEFLCFVGRKP
ncbi:maleylpyruvate isomerase N-terminal domain-containing protein [Stackebrandtia nassauensis]|uniref:Mycothiol-dependent maleylpyruvate isomerase metal-binding domain-containing protein n=1 Tax=Stackebrandtia nassauensis (strain DSM 44728 / CIP 108903 / NRRL B-16338 / NBRC 102104 / LLR-40K-21) TaxID=446470 RepID=D3PWI2_STANL|nr:maleylpyruvate isomerase N-terminal domain-containing protein [Stackebrandtia nassauensis]ADD43204.1 hypothetical protein Snas_3542 [Stackebrandtia nassauensis DSM 44728]